MFHARSLFVTAFEGKERDAIDVAVSPSECSFVHLVESQCAEKTVVRLNALSMDALRESEIFHIILHKQNIKKYEGFDCMLRIGL